jgi:hypothetical protein
VYKISPPPSPPCQAEKNRLKPFSSWEIMRKRREKGRGLKKRKKRKKNENK